jgi:hypothetical protein
MFSGPYMITGVQHNISPGEFSTTFEGTRQPFYSLPKIDNFLQSLNIKILSTIEEKYRQVEKQNREKSDNVKSQQDNVLANIKSQETLTKNQDCQENINARYFRYTPVDTPRQTSLTTKQLFEEIKQELISQGYSETGQTTPIITSIIFSFIYVDSGNGTGISGYENNYSTINLQEIYGAPYGINENTQKPTRKSDILIQMWDKEKEEKGYATFDPDVLKYFGISTHNNRKDIAMYEEFFTDYIGGEEKIMEIINHILIRLYI